MALDPITPDYQNELSPLIKPKVNELGGTLPQVPQGNALPQTLQPLVKTPRMQQEEQLQQQISKFENPNKPQGFWQNLGHISAKIGNIAGDVIAPNLMERLPGTDYNNALQHQNRVQQLTELQAGDATAQENQQKSELQQAQIGKTNAETKKLESPDDKPDAVEFQQTDHGLMRIDKTTGQATPVTFNGQPLQPNRVEKDATPIQQYMDALVSGDTKKAELIKQANRDLNVTPKIDIHNATAGGGSEGSWSLQENSEGKPVLFNPKTGELRQAPPGLQKSGTFAKNAKPTADEQRRTDLSTNLNENLGTLEGIVQRRPELFGPLAGRWTELKGKFGSDDPDIATLQTIEHQIGMAQISAHGMRSAQGIQGAADSILGNMHKGPQGILASINAARNSVKTFQDDVENKGKSQNGQSGGSNEIHTFNVNGKTYHIPGNQVDEFKKDFPNAK